MMLLSSYPNRECEQMCGVGAESGRPVEYSGPSEVVGEVFRGKTLEADHACAQARTEGIDVLYVPRALYADARREIDRMMLDFEVPSGGRKRGAPIGAQRGVGRQDRPERLADFLCVPRLQHEISGAAYAVTRDEHRHLFSRQSALGGLPATLARRTADPTALALKGSKEVRRVRHGDAHQRSGLHGLRQRQKTTAPVKRRALGYVEPLTDLTQGQYVSQSFSSAPTIFANSLILISPPLVQRLCATQPVFA